MRRRIMPVVVVALVMVALAGGAAYADTAADNAQCLTCHGPGTPSLAAEVDFGVGPVDKATACNKCHWITDHPIHNRTAVCQDCHGGWSWSRRTDIYISQTATTFGYFTSAASVDTSPAELHRIHTARSWPSEITDYAPACANCHAAASCDACHTSATAHGSHGVSGDPTIGTPTVGLKTNVTQGTPTGFSAFTDLTIDGSMACAATLCHGGVAESEFIDELAPTVTLSGAWTTSVSTVWAGGSLSTATDPGAYAEVVFTGTGITWVGSCNELGGIVEVVLDGARYGEVNLSLGQWGANKNLLVIKNLQPGSHTLRITNTGATTSVRAWITLNGFRVHGPKPALEAVPSCSTCHFTFAEHYDTTAHSSIVLGCSGVGCHATPDLMTVHNERNAAFSCGGCHDSILTAVQDAITAGDTSCGACHGTISSLGGHRDAHAAVPPLANADGTPNYSYYTGSAGTAPTRDCVSCHTSNLADEHVGLYLSGWVIFPRHDSSGAALTCGTCHDQPVGSVVQNAIAGGLSACESCHTVHAPMQVVHASTFVADPEVPCVDCHDANLATEHNGDYTSTAGLTGCDVCHELYAGATSGAVTGAATQAAIATGNDTRCSACHAAYHTDSTAHGASSAASLACGDCHAVGATVIDVTSLHPTCATCHNSVRVGEISDHTAECASCHAVEGTDYHVGMSVGHTFTGMATGCASCHPSTLPEAHESYLDRYPEYADTCALCHKNADAARIDWTTASADCSSCHTVHGDIATLHTATASDACVRCHDSADLRVLHGATMDASCATCHNATLDLTGKTAECAMCHYSGGVEYHLGADLVHIGLGSTGTCEGVGCHPSRDVTVIHERFIGPGTQYPQYKDTCALCHINDDPGRIDWSVTTDGTCANCHGVPHDRMNHTASSTMSQDCAGCHNTWVPDTHGANPPDNGTFANCDVCHNNPLAGNLTWDKTSSDCEGCHSKYPAATNHYPADMHLTSHENVCVDCHYQDLKTEHAKASIDVTCVECHTDASDAAIIAAGWNKTCDQCHMDMHNDKTTRHASTRTDCSTSGCHESDVSVIHDGLPGMGCSSCHTGPAQLDTELTKDCTTGGCHVDSYHAGLPGLHTAATSGDCTRCHDEALADGSQLEPIHGGVCGTCHTLDLAGKTAECLNCHVTSGTDYHATMTGAHTFDAMGSGCQQAGCHLNTLPEEHAKYLGRYAGYTDSCALCHLNTDAGRIDWATASADCSSCHTVHGDVTVLHTATASQACVDCHETGDAMQIHVTDTGETDCALCHAAPAGRIDWTDPSIECTYCHGGVSPSDPNHYPAAAHDASAETGCGQCHYKDMKAEHFKPTVAVSCVTCHEVKVDTFTVAWDKTCAACHPTNHGERQAKHVSTTTTCGGTGCHNISDVSDIHKSLSGGGCGACHVNPATPATTTDCTASGCHAGIGTDHRGLHEAAAANPNGCTGCHFMNLIDEHSALGYTCATCHDSTATAVTTAIAANDLRCKSCHPSMHSAQDWEFNPGRASVHRVSTDLPGMRSSFVVNGSTYTWSLPTASTFLKTGWTTSSTMSCSDCHSYTGATGPHGATMQVNIDPAYPNPYEVTTGSSTLTAQLSPNSPTGMSMRDGGSTPAGIICEKCHDLTNNGSWSNVVHKEHDDRGNEGGYCNHCHVGLPHGWSRPRMIGYTTDAEPYATYTGGITRISLKSYTPNGWSKSDCGAGCSSSRHPLSGSSWSATDGGTTPAPTTGTVSGTVKDSATNAAISSATVTVGTKTVTTSSTGAYSVADLAAGTYTMSVSATGYATQSVSVAITAGQPTTTNVALVAEAAPTTPTNLGRTGTASASSTDSGSYAASKAIDGRTDTYWRANGSRTEWLKVDLGSSKTLSSVVVNWYGTRYARTYRIETSNDGSAWTSRHSTTSGNGGIDTIALSSVSARYVRVYMTRANDGDYRIREFEVWGY